MGFFWLCPKLCVHHFQKILRNQRVFLIFLESFLIKLDSEVFYRNLFFRGSLIGNEKTQGAKTFTARVLWRPDNMKFIINKKPREKSRGKKE